VNPAIDKVNGVAPASSLLITITVIAPSFPRKAAKTESSSGFGATASIDVSPKVLLWPS